MSTSSSPIFTLSMTEEFLEQYCQQMKEFKELETDYLAIVASREEELKEKESQNV